MKQELKDFGAWAMLWPFRALSLALAVLLILCLMGVLPW